jgi:hypothetical protein
MHKQDAAGLAKFALESDPEASAAAMPAAWDDNLAPGSKAGLNSAQGGARAFKPGPARDGSADMGGYNETETAAELLQIRLSMSRACRRRGWLRKAKAWG